MMKKTTAFFAVLVMALGIGAAVVNGAQDESSWTGEVVDLPCYVAKMAKGDGHMECGSKCVKGGMPVGLLVGDTVYLLAGADHKPMNDQLAPHVSHMVTVTGSKHESKGVNMIFVKDFKMAK